MAKYRLINGVWADVDFTGYRLINGVWVKGQPSAPPSSTTPKGVFNKPFNGPFGGPI